MDVFGGIENKITQTDFSANSDITHQTLLINNKDQVLSQTNVGDTINSSESRSKQNKDTYLCKECGLQFKYKKVLQKHIAIHNQEYPFLCKLCDKHFLIKEEWTAHKLREHPQQKSKKLKCKLCNNQTYSNESEYWFHVMELHKGRESEFLICSECGKDFKTRSELMQHSRSKCGTLKLYKCKVCSKELMTPGSLYNHMRRHSGVRAFMCGYCGKQFVTLGQLQVHVRIHTQDKAFKCDVCHKGFCHRQSLITHSTIHTGVKPYQCENCCKSFSCVGNLLKHRRTHSDSCGLVPLTSHRVINPNTKVKVKINTPDSSRLKMYHKQKEIQKKALAYKKSLNTLNNVKSENAEREELQQMSDITSRTSIDEVKIPSENAPPKLMMENMLDNSSWDKSEILQAPQNEKSFQLQKYTEEEKGKSLDLKCKYCHKLYSNVRWLTKHEKQHLVNTDNEDENYPYKCSCCKVGFSTKEECKKHQEDVHSEILTCDDCNKIFSNMDSLRSHQNIHHRGLPRKIYTYICDKCGFQFHQKAILNQHEKTKCGTECSFKCDICDKMFSTMYTLKTHRSVHDVKKKFSCKFCGKSVRWKGQLKIHERSHTGEKPFKCLYCPKAFPYRESLLTHSSLHTGIKPHLCQACGSRFSCVGNLIKHRLTHASSCGIWYTKN